MHKFTIVVIVNSQMSVPMLISSSNCQLRYQRSDCIWSNQNLRPYAISNAFKYLQSAACLLANRGHRGQKVFNEPSFVEPRPCPMSVGQLSVLVVNLDSKLVVCTGFIVRLHSTERSQPGSRKMASERTRQCLSFFNSLG